jgi:hypothetical protein
MPPFTPGLTVTATAGTTSATVAIDANADQLEIQNNGAVTVFVAVGPTATVPSGTPAGTCYPVLSGQSKIISTAIGAALLAHITQAGTAEIFVTSGQGE